jgi:hypothetical protein
MERMARLLIILATGMITSGNTYRSYNNGLDTRGASDLAAKTLGSTGSNLVGEDGKWHGVSFFSTRIMYRVNAHG